MQQLNQFRFELRIATKMVKVILDNFTRFFMISNNNFLIKG